ncbi:pyridoxal phosphate-dependent aminotransferase [Streptomyces sp. SLBN-115]|uniref:pyridoxal phosphate-dependent aminotransferase n=1 Tax=Streptomyces sp. SLBN-115 TaxID=2768453 RepID=UPI001169B1DC|nr:pyridoxal phosphate-dependent aminotransferase [Streptomyces sp. SLBN-115]TQJ37045.1 aspartate/methionine/tyrosine aminotransferase [Streptomyces sp. SLBN-115]
MDLFSDPLRKRCFDIPTQAVENAAAASLRDGDSPYFLPSVDERLLDVYARAADPHDPFELCHLWLGRIDAESSPHAVRPWLAERWRASTVRRSVTPEEVLTSRATVRFIKELFNFFFRDDLYGALRSDSHLMLSGGAADEEQWGLPEVLKECIRYALDCDWYGYSDSCGRIQAREAVAAYESARIPGVTYDASNIALTMGGTMAVGTLADFIVSRSRPPSAPALCATPNYPPMVEAIACRTETRLVPLPAQGGRMSVEPLLTALSPRTPLVLLQTAANPTGAGVDETDLARLLNALSPSTLILLDECHEWLGPENQLSSARAARNVIRVSSLSKHWSAPGIKVGWITADSDLLAEYYGYASTHFGGPPSFFYTLIEVLTRMERWRVTGVQSVGAEEVREVEATYGLTKERLQAAYANYLAEREARHRSLLVLRDAAHARLSQFATVIRPRYSINTTVMLPGWDDSYRCFRDLLRETGVATYPGILNFCFSGGAVRLTSARSWQDIDTAMRRLSAHVGRGPVPHG